MIGRKATQDKSKECSKATFNDCVFKCGDCHQDFLLSSTWNSENPAEEIVNYMNYI